MWSVGWCGVWGVGCGVSGAVINLLELLLLLLQVLHLGLKALLLLELLLLGAMLVKLMVNARRPCGTAVLDKPLIEKKTRWSSKVSLSYNFECNVNKFAPHKARNVNR